MTQQLAIDIKLGTITLLNKYHLDCPDQSLNFEIMRPSPLGNPYHLKSKQHPDGHTRDEVCDFFERDLKQQIRSRGTDPETEVQGYAFFELIKLAKLVREGKQITITCCCKPKRCHGESIVRAVMWLAADPQWETYCVPFIEENTSVEVNEDKKTEVSTPIRREVHELRVPLHPVRSEEPVSGATHDTVPTSVCGQDVNKEPTLILNQLVEWRECPDYLKEFRFTRVRGVLPDGKVLLGFIHNPVKASDCDPLAEDHPSYEKAVQFWKMYSPVVG
jgi:Domain of unknown function (DUF4326)